MDIPDFMLKKLYVKGSLKKEDNGIVFKLKNAIAPAQLVGIDSLEIDGKKVTEPLRLITGGKDFPAQDIKPENPMEFNLKDKAVIKVENKEIPEGEHEITIVLHTKEVGPLSLTFKDSI